MEIPFDHTLMGMVEATQPSFVACVNGKPTSLYHGVSVFYGKEGILSICGNGRFIYHTYPYKPTVEHESDSFEIYFDSGEIYYLTFWFEGNDVEQKTLLYWNTETQHWDDATWILIENEAINP